MSLYTLHCEGKWVCSGTAKKIVDFINTKESAVDGLSAFLNTLQGKLVKFHYNGGSKRGIRIVNVEKTTKKSAGNYVLGGRDASLANDNYRQYDSKNIVGKIEVLA